MDSGSLYDQFTEDTGATFESNDKPQQESRRAEGWQQNREDNTKPYQNEVNNQRSESQPEQQDHSYYAWNRMVRFAPVACSFEHSVNTTFKANFPVITGKNFDELRSEYIAVYKQMLVQYNL